MMNQAQFVDYKHAVMKEIGMNDVEILKETIKDYNHLILSHPFILMGQSKLDYDKLKRNQQEDI